MMYLLASRCYFDLGEMKSSLKSATKIKRADPAVLQTKEKIRSLYDKLKKLWSSCSDKISEEENSLLNKIKDFFFESSSSLQEKDTYINGIEQMNFTRREHLRYTQFNYIKPLVEDISERLHPRLVKLMRHYSEIMSSESVDYRNGDFENYIEGIVQGG